MMKGIIKLKVPTVQFQLKLFVLVLRYENKQYRFSQVAYSLDKAIKKCSCYTSAGYYSFQLTDYVVHTELTVEQINKLFKDY